MLRDDASCTRPCPCPCAARPPARRVFEFLTSSGIINCKGSAAAAAAARQPVLPFNAARDAAALGALLPFGTPCLYQFQVRSSVRVPVCVRACVLPHSVTDTAAGAAVNTALAPPRHHPARHTSAPRGRRPPQQRRRAATSAARRQRQRTATAAGCSHRSRGARPRSSTALPAAWRPCAAAPCPRWTAPRCTTTARSTRTSTCARG
jgi:hypothetical protein